MANSLKPFRAMLSVIVAISLLLVASYVMSKTGRGTKAPSRGGEGDSAAPKPSAITEEVKVGASAAQPSAPIPKEAAPPAGPATDKELRKSLGDIQRQLGDLERQERDINNKLAALGSTGEGGGAKATELKAKLYDIRVQKQSLLKRKMDLTSGWFRRGGTGAPPAPPPAEAPKPAAPVAAPPPPPPVAAPTEAPAAPVEAPPPAPHALPQKIAPPEEVMEEVGPPAKPGGPPKRWE